MHDLLGNLPGLDGSPLNAVLVPCPTRAPELNPIEMCWNIYVERLVNVNTNCFMVGNNLNLRNIAANIFRNFLHDDIEKAYIKCGYYGNNLDNK